jgi:hypothetical protein
VSAGRNKRTAERRNKNVRWIASELSSSKKRLADKICAAVLKPNESAASPRPRRIRRKPPVCRPLEIDKWKTLGSTKGMAASR